MNLDTYGTLVAASLVLLLGRQLVLRIAFLRIYSIPEPVVGGLLVALAARPGLMTVTTGGLLVRGGIEC